MSKSSYAPTVPLHSVPLSPSTTLTHLETYLDASLTHAHLHPDSLLQPGGISFSTTGSGPQGSLTLASLRRIASGLRGEILAPEPGMMDEISKPNGDDVRLDAEKERVRKRAGGNELDESGRPRKSALKKRRLDGGVVAGVDFEGEVLRNGGDGEDWIDGEAWARSQKIVEGEVGERDNAAAPTSRQEGDPDFEGEPGLVPHRKAERQDAQQQQAFGGKKDKDARKAEKKARAKAERREREERKAAG